MAQLLVDRSESTAIVEFDAVFLASLRSVSPARSTPVSCLAACRAALKQVMPLHCLPQYQARSGTDARPRGPHPRIWMFEVEPVDASSGHSDSRLVETIDAAYRDEVTDLLGAYISSLDERADEGRYLVERIPSYSRGGARVPFPSYVMVVARDARLLSKENRALLRHAATVVGQLIPIWLDLSATSIADRLSVNSGSLASSADENLAYPILKECKKVFSRWRTLSIWSWSPETAEFKKVAEELATPAGERHACIKVSAAESQSADWPTAICIHPTNETSSAIDVLLRAFAVGARERPGESRDVQEQHELPVIGLDGNLRQLGVSIPRGVKVSLLAHWVPILSLCRTFVSASQVEAGSATCLIPVAQRLPPRHGASPPPGRTHGEHDAKSVLVAVMVAEIDADARVRIEGIQLVRRLLERSVRLFSGYAQLQRRFRDGREPLGSWGRRAISVGSSMRASVSRRAFSTRLES